MNLHAITVRRDMAPEVVRHVQGLVAQRDREIILNQSIARVERLEDRIAIYNGHTHETRDRYCRHCGYDLQEEGAA